MNEQPRQNFGVTVGSGTIRFQRVLPGPVDRVWAYLTDSERRGRWLASGDMDLREGGAVELLFRHDDLTPHSEEPPGKYRDVAGGASFMGRITRCEPPRLLSFTWAESWGDESEVTFELSPRDDGTVLLVLTHRRIPGDHMTGVAAGWHTHLAILEAKLAGREPPPFWATHADLESRYGRRLS